MFISRMHIPRYISIYLGTFVLAKVIYNNNDKFIGIFQQVILCMIFVDLHSCLLPELK